MEIRKARLSDLPDILEMEHICFAEDSFNKRQFTYLMTKAKGSFLSVQSGEKVVAYLSLILNQRAESVRIYSIAVHPDFRHLKIGQQLIDKTIEYAGLCGIKKITLEVKVSNVPAISLYEKNGFETTHIITNYYHDGSSAYRMKKNL
jgi:[ribosomal protein S18]-alanine N-acetyltransferase